MVALMRSEVVENQSSHGVPAMCAEFCTHHAPGRTAGDFHSLRLTKVRRARAGALCFVRLRGGVRFFVGPSHACSVAGLGGGVFSVLTGGLDELA